jgi:hypothetical protein
MSVGVIINEYTYNLLVQTIIMEEIIKRPFTRLLMGRAGIFYLDIIDTIYTLHGNNPFTWREIIDKTNSKIDKSLLQRLRDSDWILLSKRGKNKIATTWTLHPEAINYVNERKQ